MSLEELKAMTTMAAEIANDPKPLHVIQELNETQQKLQEREVIEDLKETQQKLQELDPEEAVEKYGLEVALFSALKKGTPGDLLKRYGGAYLLTSTYLALVSFTLCYI